MIERIHLNIMLALQQYQTLTAAASALNLSQSALSHQIRHLEQRLDVKLWRKEGRRLRLTQPGEQLLKMAQTVAPMFASTEHDIQQYAVGQQGRLRIGVECYPCYQWLMQVIAGFLRQSPDIDLDVIQKFQFSGVEGLLDHAIELLITPDPMEQAGVSFDALFGYELVLLLAKDHSLAGNSFCEAKDLSSETLLLFPVPPERLDIYTDLLIPAHVTPGATKVTESVDLMLQLASCGRGVLALPRWLAEQYCQTLPLTTLRMTEQGIYKTLYAAYKTEDADIPHLQNFLSLGKSMNAPGA